MDDPTPLFGRMSDQLITTVEEYRPSPLSVHVEWNDLVERHCGDVKAAFEELGQIKDFLA